MAISVDTARSAFITGLKNSHAAARECRTMIEVETKRLESYPDIRERLELHMREKDSQLEGSRGLSTAWARRAPCSRTRRRRRWRPLGTWRMPPPATLPIHCARSNSA